MTEILLIVVVALLVIVAIFQIFHFFKRVGISLSEFQEGIEFVENSYERTEQAVRKEIARNRKEANTTASQSREELGNTLMRMARALSQQLTTLTTTTDRQLRLIQQDNAEKLEKIRLESVAAAQKAREEVTRALNNVMNHLNKLMETTLTKLENQKIAVDGRLKQIQSESAASAKEMRGTMTGMAEAQQMQIGKLTETNQHSLDALKTTVEQKLRAMQNESTAIAKEMREEVRNSLKTSNDSVLLGMTGMAEAQQKQMVEFSTQLGNLTETNQHQLDNLKTAVEDKLKAIQDDNTKQLDQMRATVDEKLQGTLERRLGESFRQVSQHLEQVQKDLGEMRALAVGVGDLKKVLTNVKTRGTWGEVQLGAMLEQILARDQYAENVATTDSNNRVEFAIKLPGRNEDKNEVIWLPIDAKFPLEDHQRLVEAQEKGDQTAAEQATKQLESRIKNCAKEIHEKYVQTPKTTEFAILYLPTEGLFAEVLRRPGLADEIQSRWKIVLAGPTTLWSILNSLQMGFRTLTLQKRSSAILNLLVTVKSGWTSYAKALGVVQRNLKLASNSIDKTQKKARQIEGQLNEIEGLPVDVAETNWNGDVEEQVVPYLFDADGPEEKDEVKG